MIDDKLINYKDISKIQVTQDPKSGEFHSWYIDPVNPNNIRWTDKADNHKDQFIDNSLYDIEITLDENGKPVDTKFYQESENAGNLSTEITNRSLKKLSNYWEQNA
jgi:hypothetical protein